MSPWESLIAVLPCARSLSPVPRRPWAPVGVVYTVLSPALRRTRTSESSTEWHYSIVFVFATGKIRGDNIKGRTRNLFSVLMKDWKTLQGWQLEGQTDDKSLAKRLRVKKNLETKLEQRSW